MTSVADAFYGDRVVGDLQRGSKYKRRGYRDRDPNFNGICWSRKQGELLLHVGNIILGTYEMKMQRSTCVHDCRFYCDTSFMHDTLAHENEGDSNGLELRRRWRWRGKGRNRLRWGWLGKCRGKRDRSIGVKGKLRPSDEGEYENEGNSTEDIDLVRNGHGEGSHGG